VLYLLIFNWIFFFSKCPLNILEFSIYTKNSFIIEMSCF
jgi:hypothetical protein